jgi:DNA-binding response OmpR family regulator
LDLNREQILVVDDEEDMRHAIVEILTLEGFEGGRVSRRPKKLEQAFANRL